MSAEDWTVRPSQASDKDWILASLGASIRANSYFHGCSAEGIWNLANKVTQFPNGGLDFRVVVTADEGDPAGWVIYQEIPTLTIALAYVEPTYRGLGAWRALRTAIGLKDGQLVNVVLASPQAMGLARKKYQAKHNWGRVLEWLT